MHLITVTEASTRDVEGEGGAGQVCTDAPCAAATAVVAHCEGQKVKHDVGVGAVLAAADEASSLEVVGGAGSNSHEPLHTCSSVTVTRH